MRRQQFVWWSYQQLTAHAEVCKQRIVIHRQPQVLAPAAGTVKSAATQPLGEVGWACDVPAHRSGMQDLCRLDSPAHDQVL